MSIGLLLTSFALGLRHGIDWDHIAAIADLSGTAQNRRRGFTLSMLYAGGHGLVVFILGGVALIAGAAIPAGVDEWMGRIVGVTLIALGAWILAELVRKGKNFRLRSRWMLIIDGTFAGFRRVRENLTGRSITVEHDHDHEHVDDAHDTAHAHDHSHVTAVTAPVPVPEPVLVGSGFWRPQPSSHKHRHRHDLLLPADAQATYGGRTATGIGMLHGVGIESPTQIAIFVASTAVAGTSTGLLILGAWVIGLIAANAALAVVAGAGLLHAERSFPVYAGLATLVGIGSIAMGTLYLVL